MREQADDISQELRLVGVHEDGEHLLLDAPEGGTFRLALDEALRRAVTRPTSRRSLDDPSAPMSPRQIQAEIRAGASAEDLAASAGLPLAKIQRYEGPVLAERAHITQLARRVEVSTPNQAPGQDPHVEAFGDEPADLDDMVTHRLSDYGVNLSTITWDSWRRKDGQWTIVATFELAEDSPASIGEEPRASWTFNPLRKSISNANRWAQLLSELEPLDGPLPHRRLAAVADRPFDVEAVATPEAAEPRPDGGPEAELLELLRTRRGQRLGADEEGDDALALLLTRGIQAPHQEIDRPIEVSSEESPRSEEPAAQSRGRGEGITSLLSRLGQGRRADEEPEHMSPSSELRGVTALPSQESFPEETQPSTAVLDSSLAGELLGEAAETVENAGAPEEQPASPRRDGEKRGRQRRSSVPSWDEIVFGTKGD